MYIYYMYNETPPQKKNFVKGSMWLVTFCLGLFYYQALNIPKKKKSFSFSWSLYLDIKTHDLPMIVVS